MQGADPEFEKCVCKGRGGGSMEISLASQPNLSEVFYWQKMIFLQFITSDVWTFYFIKTRAGPP